MILRHGVPVPQGHSWNRVWNSIIVGILFHVVRSFLKSLLISRDWFEMLQNVEFLVPFQFKLQTDNRFSLKVTPLATAIGHWSFSLKVTPLATAVDYGISAVLLCCLYEE
jgi:glycopeptide antibiotics resistance protein